MRSMIVETILSKLDQKADLPVIQFEGEAISGSDFKAMILNGIRSLRDVAEGQKIALCLETCPEALALFLAGLCIAEDTGYFDPGWPHSVKGKMAHLAGAAYVIDQSSPLLSQVRSRALSRELPPGFWHSQPTVSSTFTCYTSGSTGLPKGCRRAQASWVNSFKADAEFTCLDRQDWVIVPGNFAHSLFLYAAIRGLFAGSSIALFSQFAPRIIARCIESFNRSVIFGVPTQFDMIEQAFSRRCSKVARFLATGSKLSPRLVSRLQETFPGASVVEFYGTTELSYVAARIADADDPSTLIGRPLEAVSVSVVGPDGEELPANRMGTVYVKSPLAFNGYVSEAGFQPAADIFTVGDNGYLSETGDLHLQGRLDRVFQSGGRKIIPENIEAALSTINGVQNASVLAIADPLRENRIAAVVQLHSPISRRELIETLSGSLPKGDIPHRFYVCPHFPKTVGGKTDFRALSKMVSHKQLEMLS